MKDVSSWRVTGASVWMAVEEGHVDGGVVGYRDLLFCAEGRNA